MLHEEILASAGSSWDDWRRFDPAWLNSSIAASFKARALDLLTKDFAESPLFVLKDPSICRFLPFWLEVLGEFGAEACCVITLRNPMDVAVSLRRRNQFNLPNSCMLWLRHFLEAEFASRSVRRAFVSFDDLLSDWRSEAVAMAGYLSLAWPKSPTFAESEVDAFLCLPHRHHYSEENGQRQDSDMAPWVRITEKALNDLRANRNDPDAMARLDRVRVEFNRACSAFVPLLRSSELAWQQTESLLKKRVEAAAFETKKAHANMEAFQKQLEGLHHEIRSNEKAVRNENRRVEELTLQVSARNRYIDELDNALASSRNHVSALKKQLREQEEYHQASIDSVRTWIENPNQDIETGKRNSQLSSEAMLLERERIAKLRDALRYMVAILNTHQKKLSWQMARPLHWLELKIPWLFEGAAAFLKSTWWIATGQLSRRLALWRQASEITESGLFEENWYLEQHPEVLESGYRPLYHWLLFGAYWKWDPHPLFDVSWYDDQHPVETRTESNPVLDYIREGIGYDPHPLFDAQWYLKEHPGLDPRKNPPLVHFLIHGATERSDPHPLFDSSWYHNSRNTGFSVFH